MLQRGQKIIVTKNLGGKNQRPLVGYIGFLSNMYLYVSDKFILANAFFFKHGSKNLRTVEKKKFIVDIGMDKKLRSRILQDKMPIKFLLNRDVVNLTSVGYYPSPSAFVDMPLMYSNSGIWHSVKMDKKNKRVVAIDGTDKKDKIPICDISAFHTVENRKYRMEETDNIEFKALISSLSPIAMVMTMGAGNVEFSAHNNKNHQKHKSCFGKSREFIDSVQSCLSLVSDTYYEKSEINDREIVILPSGHAECFLRDMHKLPTFAKHSILRTYLFLKSLNKSFVNELDKYNLNRMIFTQSAISININQVCTFFMVGGIVNLDNIPDMDNLMNYKILQSILIRHLLTKNTTPVWMKYFLSKEYVQTIEQNIEKISKMCNDADHGLSALNRFYSLITPPFEEKHREHKKSRKNIKYEISKLENLNATYTSKYWKKLRVDNNGYDYQEYV